MAESSWAWYGRGSMVNSASPFFRSAPSVKWISVMRPETCGWMETISRATILPISSRYTGTSPVTADATATVAGGRWNEGAAAFSQPARARIQKTRALPLAMVLTCRSSCG